jgi:hypothetical protein
MPYSPRLDNACAVYRCERLVFPYSDEPAARLELRLPALCTSRLGLGNPKLPQPYRLRRAFSAIVGAPAPSWPPPASAFLPR